MIAHSENCKNCGANPGEELGQQAHRDKAPTQPVKPPKSSDEHDAEEGGFLHAFTPHGIMNAITSATDAFVERNYPEHRKNNPCLDLPIPGYGGRIHRNEMECTQAVLGGLACGTTAAAAAGGSIACAHFTCPGTVAAGAGCAGKIPVVGAHVAEFMCPTEVAGAAFAVPVAISAGKNSTAAVVYNLRKGYVDESDTELRFSRPLDY